MRGTATVMRPSSVSSSTVPPAPADTARSAASAASGDTIAAMICPPSKASSMRIESSDRAHHLGQDAVHGVGMDERNLEPEEPVPRFVVDQLDTLAREVGERRADVFDLVRDVMHAGPAVRQETADGRVVAGRCEQLDAVRADEDGGGLDALLLHALAVLDRRAEQLRVRGDRLVEIGHGEAEMMDPPDAHAAIVLGRFRDGTSTSSTSPYSTASAGVMKRSRSMSSSTCSGSRPEWRAMISAI